MRWNDQRSVRIATTPDLTVDGVVRVRRIDLRRWHLGLRLERRGPLAIVVSRGARAERVTLDHSRPLPAIAWLALPLAALFARRVSQSFGRRGG